jgi:thiamine kinase-like enzyme
VERAIARWTPEDEPPVPSHRDCHPGQVVRTENGVRLIDLDDSAMAPPGIDVGNFVAHLEMDAHIARRTSEGVAEAIDAFLEGYGLEPPTLDSWTRLSLARLAALAETRHRLVERAEVLAAAVDRILPVRHGRPA